MKTKNKNILLGVLVVGVVAMTVAFAALATNLRISGTANTAATKWNIHFQNWVKRNPQTVDGHNNTVVSPEVSSLTMADNSNVTKVEGINVTLNQPGDTARYTFEIINEGTIDAKLSNFTPSITNGNSNVIEYTVECRDDETEDHMPAGTEITTNSVLQANGGLAYCLLEVKYKDQTNAQTPGASQVYEQNAINATISATWTWIQDDGVVPISWNYRTPTQKNGGPTLPEGSQFWIQINTNTSEKQVCGVFPNRTVCLEADMTGRQSEFENSSQQIVTGYTLQKMNEMTAAGATCYVNAARIDCSNPDTKVHCYVLYDGSVDCSININEYHGCTIGNGFGCA